MFKGFTLINTKLNLICNEIPFEYKIIWVSEMTLDPIKRFTGRAENYDKYRPTYPKEIILELKSKINMTPDKIIVEIGSGTGKLTKILLEEGYTVYGVEPNDEMRELAERSFRDSSKFISINGRAENTTIDDDFADFIIIAQAIHWFKPIETLREFHRILKPEGKIAIIWNQRDIEGSNLQKRYEEILLTYSPEYRNMPHRNLDQLKIREYIEPSSMREYKCKFSQNLSFSDMKGRLDSTSYVPKQDDPNYTSLIKELREMFDSFQKNELLEFPYITRLLYGNLCEIEW